MSKLKIDRYVSGWGDAQACPCDSGRAFSECCQRERHRPPVMDALALTPPGKKTDFSNPKCFMWASMNCSEKLSREHYISHSILKTFGDLTVEGMPWQDTGEKMMMSADSLTAKVLCERHNNALSPLDSLAFQAFSKIGQAVRYAADGAHKGSPRHYFISGDGLELWGVKLLAGIFEAGIARAESRKIRDFGHMDHHRIADLLGGPRNYGDDGLFLAQEVGEVVHRAMKIAPLMSFAGQAVGVRVDFGTLHFDVLTEAHPDTRFLREMRAQNRHRPTIIDFHGPNREARLVLSWERSPLKISRVGVEIEPAARVRE